MRQIEVLDRETGIGFYYMKRQQQQRQQLADKNWLLTTTAPRLLCLVSGEAFAIYSCVDKTHRAVWPC